MVGSDVQVIQIVVKTPILTNIAILLRSYRTPGMNFTLSEIFRGIRVFALDYVGKSL